MYKFQKNGDLQSSIIRLSDGACIPQSPLNVDYVAYLKWVEDGGVTLPADEDSGV